MINQNQNLLEHLLQLGVMTDRRRVPLRSPKPLRMNSKGLVLNYNNQESRFLKYNKNYIIKKIDNLINFKDQNIN